MLRSILYSKKITFLDEKWQYCNKIHCIVQGKHPLNLIHEIVMKYILPRNVDKHQIFS